MKDELIIAYLNNECSVAEKEFVEKWLGEAPGNRKRFEETKLIWDLSGTDFSRKETVHERSWERISNAMHGDHSLDKSVRIHRLRVFWRIAASVALIVGLGYLSTIFIGRDSPDTTKIASAQTRVEKSEVVLPDGTHVWLNAHTMLTYPEKFDRKNRKVTLTGEAYFEVEHNRRNPFTVEFSHSVVEVLGTSFNINSFSGNNGQVVTVVTGKVAFHAADDPSNAIFLESGDRGVFSVVSDSYVKEKNYDLNYLSWKTGIMTFDSTPLRDVCRIITEYFGQQVLLEGSGLDEKVLTATFDNRELKDVLAIVTMTLDLSIRVEGDMYIIY